MLEENMLYKSGQERYHEEIEAIRKAALSLYKPASLEEITKMASAEVNREIECFTAKAELDEMCEKKILTKSQRGYAPTNDDFLR